MVPPLTLETRAGRRKSAMPAARTICCYPRNLPSTADFTAIASFLPLQLPSSMCVTQHGHVTCSRSPLGSQTILRIGRGWWNLRVRPSAFKIIQETHQERLFTISPVLLIAYKLRLEIEKQNQNYPWRCNLALPTSNVLIYVFPGLFCLCMSLSTCMYISTSFL